MILIVFKVTLFIKGKAIQLRHVQHFYKYLHKL